MDFYFTIRIATRARRFLLPFWMAYSGAKIILSEDLMPKKITLNVLALIFIFDTNNLIVVLLSSKIHEEKADYFVENVKTNNVKIGYAGVKQDAILDCFDAYSIRQD